MRRPVPSVVKILLSLAMTIGGPAMAWPRGVKVPGTQGGFVTATDGVKIHYVEAGPRFVRLPALGPGGTPPTFPSGKPPAALPPPAILFVPGWTMPGWIWGEQIEHFSDEYRVVAMDPRSQGESTKASDGNFPAVRARDIKAVVDQLHLAPVVLVGWSMGATELAAYVDQFGTATLAGLVFVDGSAGGFDSATFAKAMDAVVPSMETDRPKFTEQFVRSMYRKPQSEEYLERVVKASLQTPTNSALALMVAAFVADYRPALAKIDKPALIVASQGPLLALLEDMQTRIPGATLEVFSDAGHALFVDDAGRFDALLDGFLRNLKSPGVGIPSGERLLP